MRIVRLSSLLLVLLLCLPVLGQVQISIRRAAAVGGCTWTEVSDDFNRANSDTFGADWTETTGDMDINTNQGAQGTTATLEAAWDTEGAAIGSNQYSCFQNVQSSNASFGGPMLRIPDLTCTGISYAVRWQESSSTVVVRECATCTSCSTFGTWSNDIENTSWLCAEVQGTGADTEFALWEFTSAPGDRDTWDDPDACVCDGASCSLYTCGSSIDGEPSDAPGFTAYQDCAGGCYFGVYSGSSAAIKVDNFTGGWCD